MKILVNLKDVISGKTSPPPCDSSIGIQLLQADNGHAKCLWKIEKNLLNGNGVVMGGFTASAADIAIAYAVTTLLKGSQTFASINLDTTFHRPLVAGEAEVEARVERFGAKTAYVQAKLWQNEKRVADTDSSIMIFS